MNAPTDPNRSEPLPGWGPPPTAWPSAPPPPPAPPPPLAAGPQARPAGPPPWPATGGANPPPTWPHEPFDHDEPSPPRSAAGLQNLLLILGTSLVAVSALVFMAVNWSRLGARFQGAILLAITGFVGVVASACSRRRLPATAEALGVVAVLLALVDAHALRVGLHPGLSGASWWAIALLVVSGVAWTFSEASGIESPRVAAAALAQLPLPLLVLSSGGLSWSQAELLLLAQVAVVALVSHLASGRYRRAGGVAFGVAAVTGLGVVGAALIEALWEGAGERGPALVLVAAAAVAALTSWRWEDRESVRIPALLTASVVGLTAVDLLLSSFVDAGMGVALVALTGAVLAAVAIRSGDRWGQIPAGVGAITSVLWSTPVLLAASATTADLGRAIDRPWAFDLGDRASALQRFDTTPSGGALAVHLAALAVLALAGGAVLRRRGTTWLLAGVAALAALLAPALGPVSITVAAGIPFALAAGLAAVSALSTNWSSGDRRLAAGAAAALALVGLGWSVAVTPLTVVALVVIVVLAAAVAVSGRARLDLALAAGGGIVAVVAGSALAAVGFAADGMGSGAAWAAGSVAACALGMAAVLLRDLDRSDPKEVVAQLDRALSVAAEVAAWAVHGIALLAVVVLDDRTRLSVVLAAGTIAAGLHAARPGRRPLAIVAIVQGMLLVWLQLLEAGVRAPEPYILPVAVVLGAAGLLAERRAAGTGERLPSWTTIGPALVVGFAPSTWLAFTEGGVARPLVTLAAGGVVLAFGALTGRRAAVDVGVAVVVALGLRQIAPVVGSLPGWVTIGSTGALLLAVGATFEQRRRDVSDVRRQYEALV